MQKKVASTEPHTITASEAGRALNAVPLSLDLSVPKGLTWLDDTLSGIDLYDKGFVRRPSLFFDPSATSSLGLGTLKHPYFTQAQLMLVINGNMSGQVLGLKRGTTLRVTGTMGLQLDVYGSPGKPFTICPYGDAEALPIITSGAVVLNWTLEDGAANIWSYPMGAIEHDCWQNEVRLWKKTFAGSAAASLTTEGSSAYVNGILYVRPYAGEDPRLGQMEVSSSQHALMINYSNVPHTGYIHVCGVEARKARNVSISVAPPTTGVVDAIVSINDISLVGCRATQAGADGPMLASDGITMIGLSDAIRLKGGYVAGNRIDDVLNNAIEYSCTSGLIVEKNISSNCGGNSIVELWSSNDNSIIRYNYGYYSTTRDRRQLTYASGGIWFANNYQSAGSLANNDATNTRNFDNVAHHNMIVLPGLRGVRISGGTGLNVYQNTIYYDEALTDPAGKQQCTALYIDGAAADGFVNFSNNLVYFKRDPLVARFPRMVNLNPGAGRPTGDRNIYFTEGSGMSGDGFYTGADGTTNNIVTYKARMATSNFDQNSIFGPYFIGSNATVASMGMHDESMRIVAAGHIGKAVSTIGRRYFDGQPYAPDNATIGALAGR
ncbi:hypothetical protein [Janthinobacterium sp. BJB304]|uniref:hypothetical protein n=1 Tax=Janthinobacterium sp. BJB304 TaxID=1572871 RepID=UPI000C0E4C19|nr:hypothetical protein [Janthinobacterium sp. BJB304]PHV36355.1 hypothetical protein CSQ95_24690 [Janthinobacterium sp. BJB304]